MKKYSLNDLISMGVMHDVQRSYSVNWFVNPDFVLKLKGPVVDYVKAGENSSCLIYFKDGSYVTKKTDDQIFYLYELVLVQR